MEVFLRVLLWLLLSSKLILLMRLMTSSVSSHPILADTQLLLWWAIEPKCLPKVVIPRLEDPLQPLVFSVVSLWEVAG